MSIIIIPCIEINQLIHRIGLYEIMKVILSPLDTAVKCIKTFLIYNNAINVLQYSLNGYAIRLQG